MDYKMVVERLTSQYIEVTNYDAEMRQVTGSYFYITELIRYEQNKTIWYQIPNIMLVNLTLITI